MGWMAAHVNLWSIACGENHSSCNTITAGKTAQCFSQLHIRKWELFPDCNRCRLVVNSQNKNRWRKKHILVLSCSSIVKNPRFLMEMGLSWHIKTQPPSPSEEVEATGKVFWLVDLPTFSPLPILAGQWSPGKFRTHSQLRGSDGISPSFLISAQSVNVR